MSTNSFDMDSCEGTISIDPSCYDVVLEVRYKELVDSNSVQYIAASPPDYRASFSGSGLPFPSIESAFENTPNQGTLALNGNVGVLKMFLPNSYYVDFNGTLVEPCVELYYSVGGSPRKVIVHIGDRVPYRSLTYPPQRKDMNAMFYARLNLPIRGQAQVLMDSGYPKNNRMEADFWGLRPPL